MNNLGNYSPLVRDPTVLNDLFVFDDCLKGDDSLLFHNSSADPLSGIDCKYTAADNVESFPKTLNTSTFSTFCLNIRSLCNTKNLDSLKCALESMNSYPTVIGITETWLKKNSRDPCTELSNYAFFAKSRSKCKGGGVGLYIRKNLTHWLRDDLSMFEEGCFESIFVEINLGKFKIICGTVYRPPFTDSDLNTKFLDTLSLVLGKLKREKKLLFLMGDFNRNLLDPDLQTDLFLDEMFSCGLFPLIDKPTRISTTATLLDNIWTNNYIHPCKSAIVTDPISDHFAVFQSTLLPTSISHISNAENIRILNDTNLHRFQEMLEELCWEDVYEQIDPDPAFTMFLEKLQSKYNEAFPVITRVKPKSKINGWFDAELSSLQKAKRTAYLRFLRTNDPESQMSYHKIRNHYERVIKTKKSQYFEKRLASCRNDLKHTWYIINDIIGRKISISPNCIKSNDRLLTDSLEIAESFNEHFSTIASKLRTKLDSSLSSKNSKSKSSPSKIFPSLFFTPTTAYEVKKVISTIKPKNSCGVDEFPTKLLRYLPTSALDLLAHIFNLSLSTGKYISVFKVAKVTPVYKNGNAHIVSNYRPISVLSAFSKILEKLVHKRILSFLNQNNILSNLQFGFRPSFSTQLACSYLSSKISDLFHDNNLVLAIFLDLTKAFDTLDHDILLSKLSNYGFRGVVNDWFRDYLNGRQQKVRINDKYSNLKPISYGVPQGSTLGPVLFLIYINDVFQNLDYETILYADDATVLVHAKSLPDLFNTANESLNIVHNNLLINKLTLNIAKTKFMILTPQPHRLVRNPDHVISVNKIPISEVSKFRFLGVTLSNNLSWKSHIESVHSKLRTCLGIIYKARDCLNTSCLMSIFHSLASSHLNYCITTWCNTNFSKISKLQNLCNRILRLIFHRCARDNIDDIYKKFAILKIKDKFKFEICCLVYKFLHQLLPACFNKFFQRNSEIHSRRTRQSNDLHLPLFRKSICKQSLKFVGVKLWNEIPDEIKQSKTLGQFKKRLRYHFLNNH